MIRVISVKFRDGGKSYFFDPGELEIKAVSYTHLTLPTILLV